MTVIAEVYTADCFGVFSLALVPEKTDRERRQGDREGIRATMERYGNRLYATEIAHVATAVLTGVAVQDLLPVSTARGAKPIAVTGYGREVSDDENNGRARFPFAKQSYRTAIGVVTIDPFEARRVAIHFVQCRLAAIKAVEILYPILQSGMERIV
jgi:hypothetical protein